MRLVFGHDMAIAEWVSLHLGQPIVRPFTAIGATRDGVSLCAGVVFNGWNGSNVDLTIYGPGCLTRGNLAAVFHYVFVQLKANRATAMTRRSNKIVQRMLPRLGFVFEGVAKRWFGPTKADDAMIFALFPAAAEKWMKVDGIDTTTSAAA